MTSRLTLLLLAAWLALPTGCAHPCRHPEAPHDRCQGNGPADVMVPAGGLCVDVYEASIWSSPDGTGTAYGVETGQSPYPATFPENGNATVRLYAVSRAGVLPSQRVTWFQAQQACAASGKRLLTNAEWQLVAAGTPDLGTDEASAPCNVFGDGPLPTGARPACVSSAGVHDLVGNAWEWVADWSFAPGDVHAHNGPTYGEDWIYMLQPFGQQAADGSNFPAGLARGGGWQQGKAAGVFTIYASAGLARPTIGPTDGDMGFRCAR